MSTQLQYRAAMEDGSTIEVTADQRDIAKFEREPEIGRPFYALSQAPYTAARWLCWHAAKRRGLTMLDWDAFDDLCVEVEDVTPDDAPEVDPTPKAASAGTSSK